MAVLFHSQNDNKENVPPFFPKQDALLVAKSKSPLPTSNKRRVRRPLEDITNLLNQEIFLRSVLDDRIRILQSLPSASRLKCGKRRAEDDDLRILVFSSPFILIVFGIEVDPLTCEIGV
ncbi:hypothetical protein POTOM_015177 [Populus tomentosa]|uniref:Uncharacterized protein n=1 Tax=Populus tomentosa TaxID=118781 RepID=A0A8X7ZZH2_POPTO|nr:hypothetical protein POTOM_015177 [Populus tomentosa]